MCRGDLAMAQVLRLWGKLYAMRWGKIIDCNINYILIYVFNNEYKLYRIISITYTDQEHIFSFNFYIILFKNILVTLKHIFYILNIFLVVLYLF